MRHYQLLLEGFIKSQITKMEDKKILNILILSWRGPGHPNAGGAEQSTFEHARGWVKKGHKVTLFTSFYKGASKKEEVEGVNIIRSGRQIFGVHIAAVKWYLLNRHQIFDLVIDQFHGIPFFTPLYVKVKKLAFIHEVTKEVWVANAWSNLLYQVPFTIGMVLEPLIFKIFYSHIPFMTVSESTKRDLVSWGILKSNIKVIYNGVNKPLLKSTRKKEKNKTLLFLGALTRDKGMEDALQIFSILGKLHEEWSFWVVGKENVKGWKFRSRELGIEKKIKFWGFVSEEKKYELLERAHILINPSIREGWGLVVIEAAIVGTPTVGYDVPGLRDSIINGKTGVLCDPNPNAGAKAILELLRNVNKYEILRANCFEWAKKFNWIKASDLSLRLIENIVKA